MPLPNSKVILACAGSGKTRRLVYDALSNRDSRIALITYTNNNVREIIQRFNLWNSGVPKNVDVMTWYGFLLRECARPYQHTLYSEKRIDSILFVNQQSARFARESDVQRHYFAGTEMIYSDKISKFVVNCEIESSGAITSRLAQIYTDIFIDEFQDLAGWDLEFIKSLMDSELTVTLVGDPRQHIYSTNPSQKNKRYLGIGVIDLVNAWNNQGLCSIEQMNGSHRCAKPICEFSNKLWPGMESMVSLRTDSSKHEGIFLVAENYVQSYIDSYAPVVLRHDKRTETFGFKATNFGLSKGLEFDRVLIFPTNPIKKYIRTGDLTNILKSRDRVHVAITRAWNSVAFVFNDDSPVVLQKWTPRQTG